MSQSSDSLGEKIEQLETKADDYQTATNFEETLKRYNNDLDSVGSALGRLKRNVERMEFLNSVLVDVIERQSRPPSEVVDARQRVRSVVDRTEDDYWEMVDAEDTEQYEREIRQAKSDVQTAVKAIEDELDSFEDEWDERIGVAREVQKLLGDSRDMTDLFYDIENFLEKDLRDGTESIPSLRAEWQGLRKSWEKRGIDWSEFQAKHDLSDKTIDRLQILAEGEDIRFDRLDQTIATELLSVEALRDVIKLTI